MTPAMLDAMKKYQPDNRISEDIEGEHFSSTVRLSGSFYKQKKASTKKRWNKMGSESLTYIHFNIE